MKRDRGGRDDAPSMNEVCEWQVQTIRNANMFAAAHHALHQRLQQAQDTITELERTICTKNGLLNTLDSIINDKDRIINTKDREVGTKDLRIEQLQAQSARDLFAGPQTCPVCGELKKLSLLLPCLHSCCHICLTSWRASVLGHELKCMVCRKKVLFTHDFDSGNTTSWTHSGPQRMDPDPSPQDATDSPDTLWVPDGSEMHEDLY
jgi:hypothetical protein